MASNARKPDMVVGKRITMNSKVLFMSAYEGFIKRHLFDNESLANQSSSSDNSSSEASTSQQMKMNFQSMAACSEDCGANCDLSEKQKLHPMKYEPSTDVASLRQPRALYAEWSEAGPQHLPKWPVEMQIAIDHVHHVCFDDSPKEPLLPFSSDLDVIASRVLSRTGGRVVYSYKPLFASSFTKSCVGGSKEAKQFIQLEPKSNDRALVFESRFESANLEKAVQVSEYGYDLYLRPDLYHFNQTQWFYFRVKNTCANPAYRFSVVNLTKPNSLYRCGVKPLMYSVKLAESSGIGWHRIGEDIKYSRNQHLQDGNVPTYSLSFTCKFPYEHDTVYFAHSYPYTYSDLQEFLLEMQQNAKISEICRQRVLCWSLAGNLVPLLTITSPDPSTQKKAIVVTARVHPGETNASWIVKGFVEYLLSDHPCAKVLRSMYIFKVVPMLNPDGVIVGNYRCSLTGRDLNRQYRTVLKEAFPSVWYTRQLIQRLNETNEVFLFCDIHGHSRKHNVFLYGCEGCPASYRKEWIFPYLMHQTVPTKVSLESCIMKMQRSRTGTARVSMWRLGIANSYTLEASMGGSTVRGGGGFHFTVKDYEMIGQHFCEALHEYSVISPSKLTELHLTVKEYVEENILSHLEGADGNNSDDDLATDLSTRMARMKIPVSKKRSRSFRSALKTTVKTLPARKQVFKKVE